MPSYQLWVLEDDYTRVAFLRTFAGLRFSQTLNGLGSATLDMHPEDPKIAELTLGRRLLIVRDGDVVFGGRLLREGWNKPENAPAGETWQVYAVDAAHYAKRRVVVPPAGQEYDARTDHADDLAKAYVYNHCGAGADADRVISDLTVQADAHAAASVRIESRYSKVLDLLVKLHDIGRFDWRFVPSWTGEEFRTGYPQWGLDRTKGNGVNDEFVLSVDRRTFSEIGYTRDAIEHANYVYVAGQGEGADRTIVERSTPADIAAWGCSEAFVDARDLTLVASLQARGDGVLQEMKPVEAMTGRPVWDSWRSATPPTWDLGDLVTIYARQWGRTFSMNAKVISVEVYLSPDGLEQVTPELEAA